MNPLLIQLRATDNGDGMTGIYWYARQLRDALAEFVDVQTHEFWKWEIEAFGRRWGGLVTLYLGKWAGVLPDSDVVHAPHITNLHRQANVLTIHDCAPKRFPHEYQVTGRMWRRFDDRIRAMPSIVTPSTTVRQELLADGFDDDQVHAAPLGLAPPPAHEPVVRERPYVVMVGEMRPRKRSLESLQAMAGVDVDVVRIGPPMTGSRYAEDCRHAAKVLGRRYQDVGYVTRSQLYGYLAGANALVYPSVYEGFGLPPLEAASVGTPSILGPADVFQETLGDASVQTTGDAESIRQAVETAVEPGFSAQNLADRAAAFSWRRCAIHHLQAYEAAKEASSGS